MTVGNETKAEVDVRRATPADTPAVLDLLRICLAGGPTGERTAEFFAWKHDANPFGPSPAWVAVDADTGAIVGLRTWLRWELAGPDGTVLRAVRAVDTATHPDHQGRGIFRRLTTQSLEELAGEVDLVFNTPNDASGPGYLRMGWDAVGKVDLGVAPRRPLRMLAHRHDLASGGSRPGAPPCALAGAGAILDDPRLADLVAGTAAAGPGLHTRRSLAYLVWRYSPPGLGYHAAVVESGGELAAVAFCRPRHRGALAELIVADVLVRAGDRDSLAAVLAQVRRSAGDYAVALPPSLLGSGLRDVARGWLRLRRAGPLLTTRPLRPLGVDVTDPHAWSLCLGDLEVF